MMRNFGMNKIGILLVLLLFGTTAKSQCELFDFFGNPTDTPYWYSCNGNDFTLNVQSPNNIGAWTMDWGDGSPLESGTDLVPPNVITHTYAATVDTFIVVFTETATGCTVNGVVVMEEATSASIQIPVGGLTQACAPQTMEFINSSTNTSETTVFTWDFGDGSPIEVYDYTNLGQTVSHTYLPGTVDCETVVTLTAENYCNTVQGGPSSATFNPIRIWDIDDAGITASETVLCFPDNEVTYTNTTERNCLMQGNIYQRYEYWNFGDYWGLGYDSIIDWRAWPPTFPVTIEYPGIGSYTTTLLDSNLCGIDVATITIEIVPPPTAAAAVDAATICEGEVVTFENNSSGNATDFVWNFDDGTPEVFSGAATIDHVFSNTGNYIVSLIASVGGVGGGCADTAYVPITVEPTPVADILLDNDSACDVLDVNFTDNSSGTISSWEWNFGNSSTSLAQNPPTITYNNPGSYNVVLTVEAPNGCKNSDSEIVTVYESPVADFIVSDVCIGSEGTFTDLSSSAAGDPITSWEWDFGDSNTSTDQNPVHTYNTAGIYTVTLTVNTDHCSASTSTTVIVVAAPLSDFTADIVTGCAPLDVNFSNNSIGAASYTWLFGDGGGSGDENPTHTFENFGDVDSVYTVQLIAMNAFGCRDTSDLMVTVHPNAVSQFQTFYTPQCSPAPANFINNSINADSFTWNFGDGSPESNDVNASHQFENTGLTLETFTVTLIAYTAFGCNDTSTVNISVFPEPNFDFSLADDTACSPFEVQFPLVSGAISYYWTFGDGTISTSPSPAHTYGNNTLVPITYSAELVGTSAFGCQDTATADITVNPDPIPQFSVSATGGCGPLTVSFENESILADSVVWNYGDGTESDTMATVHEHVFENNTDQNIVYTIQLTAFTTEGCSETFTRNIEVYPQVEAGFTHPLESCSPLSFEFENTSVNAGLYQWDLGNGVVSVAENPMGGYMNNSLETDTFDIQLIATSIFGCEDTARSEIVVFPKPNSSFVPNNTAGCSPLTVTLQNNSTTGANYYWNYGDGEISDTTAAVHEHTFYSTSTATQNFEISLIAETEYGCSDTSFFEVTVYPEVIANFTGSPLEGCSPLQTNFVNQSFGASTYFWSFGDGSEAFVANPSYLFANTSDSLEEFNIQMIAQSGFGCTDTAYGEVNVFPVPNIDMVVAGIEGCFPAEFTFANISDGAEIFAWDYGDGNTSNSTDSLHQHTYVNTSTEIENYTITLTGTSSFGCSASTELDIEVIPEIVADVAPPPGGCSPYTAVFENNSTGALTHYWDFGDGEFSEESNPTHIYDNNNAEDAVYTVTYIAQSLWGCADSVSFDIPVLGLPNAAFVAAPTVQQFPESTVEIVNLSNANPGSQYTWDWDDGNQSVSTNPDDPQTYTYDSWGEFTIQLTVGNEVCSDSSSQTITIEPPLPIADFTGEGKGCSPLVVAFESTSTYAESFLWNFGDGTKSELPNPTHTYYEPGTYNVTLTVIGPGGDQDIEIKTGIVTVHPRAEAYFTVNPPVITIPDQVFFLNLSTDANDFLWDFGDGGSSTAFSPYHFYETEGWHPVTLIANNDFNCPDTFRVDQAVRGNVETRIAFPNAFTPNQNGGNGGYWTVDDMFNNDIFFPLYKGVEEFEMQIFNRWGELLYETSDVRKGWDGYYRGKPCKQDVYVWKVNVTFKDGGKLTDSGDVTLIR